MQTVCMCKMIWALTTNDAYCCPLTSAPCYQLVQSVLKIGSVVAKKLGQEEVGRYIQDMPSTCWLPWLAIEGPWSAMAELFLTLLAPMDKKKQSSPLVEGPFLGL